MIDYHRPFHHNNLIDPARKIFVVDDGCKSFVECPTEDDVRIFQELQQQSEESDEDEDEDNEADSDEISDKISEEANLQNGGDNEEIK